MQQFIGRVVQAARNNTAKVAVDRFVKPKPFLKVKIKPWLCSFYALLFRLLESLKNIPFTMNLIKLLLAMLLKLYIKAGKTLVIVLRLIKL